MVCTKHLKIFFEMLKYFAFNCQCSKQFFTLYYIKLLLFEQKQFHQLVYSIPKLPKYTNCTLIFNS